MAGISEAQCGLRQSREAIQLMRYHLVHVGKCGGESVIRALGRSLGRLQVHHSVGANEAIADAVLRRDPKNAFIVLSRDPVARFISAFEWDLHSKSLDGDGETMKNAHWGRIYRGFRNANALAVALSSADRELRDLAHLAFDGSDLHMQFDLAWYLPPLIAGHLPAERTYLIRTESIDADMAALCRHLGLRDQRLPVTKNDYKHRLPADRLTRELSEEGRRNVMLKSHASYATMAELDRLLSATAG